MTTASVATTTAVAHPYVSAAPAMNTAVSDTLPDGSRGTGNASANAAAISSTSRPTSTLGSGEVARVQIASASAVAPPAITGRAIDRTEDCRSGVVISAGLDRGRGR